MSVVIFIYVVIRLVNGVTSDPNLKNSRNPKTFGDESTVF